MKRLVVVTGAARRLGGVIADAFANANTHLVLHGNRNTDELLRRADTYRSAGCKVTTVVQDFAASEGIESLARTIETSAGDDVLLVNNASMYQPGKSVYRPWSSRVRRRSPDQRNAFDRDGCEIGEGIRREHFGCTASAA